MFEVIYHNLVISEDIPKIDPAWKSKIQSAVERKLTTRPEVYGKPLQRSLRGYRKLRVGDYRIIHRIEKYKVKILAIQHRSVVYRALKNRF